MTEKSPGSFAFSFAISQTRRTSGADSQVLLAPTQNKRGTDCLNRRSSKWLRPATGHAELCSDLEALRPVLEGIRSGREWQRGRDQPRQPLTSALSGLLLPLWGGSNGSPQGLPSSVDSGLRRRL